MKRNYVKALTSLLLEGKDPAEIFRGFEKVLKARGHESLRRSVLLAVIESLEAQEKSLVPVVVVQNKDADIQKAAIEEALRVLGGKAKDCQTREDDSLIGGFTVTYKHMKIDRSYKTILVSLYEATQVTT